MIPDATLSPSHPTTTRSWRAWALWSERSALIAYLLTIEVVAVAGTIAASMPVTLTAQAAWRTVLLLGLAVVFEEATSRAGRLRLRLSEHLKPDMTSVWFVPAAILLPAPYAIACVATLLCYMWIRQQRPAGEIAYRKVGTAAMIIIACLATGLVVKFIAARHLDFPGGVTGAFAVLIALVVYTVVNRALVTVALTLLGVRGRGLLGSWQDNLLELATLCLGGLAVLAVRDEPWLAVLVLLPMVLLERGALTHQLEVAATTDSKTGLLNATAWEHLAQRELSRAQREGYPTVVFIIDLDRFKTVNDVHGHLVGDAALKAVGQCLLRVLRGYDTVGRFGGEEFVALLPNVGESKALDIAQRLRAEINEIRISALVTIADASTDIVLAASIGVAVSPTDGLELMGVLHVADAALYTAKQAGRNRVQLAGRGTASGARIVPTSTP
jgi:diguanylate cyclase (GGDEF)-like protein